MRMIYTAALTPQENSSGYYARIPDVPGCVTTGRDLPETLDNIQDALAGCLCVLEDEHQPLPTPRPPEAFEDTLKYRMETDTHAVRKNVSLPAWMATLADQRGVNCSQVLQDALRNLFGRS